MHRCIDAFCADQKFCTDISHHQLQHDIPRRSTISPSPSVQAHLRTKNSAQPLQNPLNPQPSAHLNYIPRHAEIKLRAKLVHMHERRRAALVLHLARAKTIRDRERESFLAGCISRRINRGVLVQAFRFSVNERQSELANGLILISMHGRACKATDRPENYCALRNLETLGAFQIYDGRDSNEQK